MRDIDGLIARLQELLAAFRETEIVIRNRDQTQFEAAVLLFLKNIIPTIEEAATALQSMKAEVASKDAKVADRIAEKFHPLAYEPKLTAEHIAEALRSLSNAQPRETPETEKSPAGP